MITFGLAGADKLEEADRLLYKVLWKPYGMERDMRKRFSPGIGQSTFVASDGEKVCGCIVACEHEDAVELRHMAVLEECRGTGIGTGLLNWVAEHLIRETGKRRIFVYARSSSAEFYLNRGFKPMGSDDWLDHPLFEPHGIRFKQLFMDHSF